ALQAVEAQKAAVNAQIEQTKAEQKRDDLRNWKQAEAHRARLTVLLEALSDHCEESFLAYQNVWRQKAPEGDHNQLAFAPETSPYDNFKSLRTPQDEIKEITSGMPFYDEPIVERLAEIFADFQVQYARMQGFQQYKNNQKPAGLIFIPHKHAEERAYEIFTTGMKVSSLYDWARKNENTETFAKNYSTPFSKEYIDRKLEFCTYNESFVRNIRKRFTEPYLRQNKAENEDV
ncbi:MAG: hypothetical protein OIF54_04335, partial [Cohaesibacter sp.]|nr:hypothetical protein [Cohaesibacter sp.]